LIKLLYSPSSSKPLEVGHFKDLKDPLKSRVTYLSANPFERYGSSPDNSRVGFNIPTDDTNDVLVSNRGSSSVPGLELTDNFAIMGDQRKPKFILRFPKDMTPHFCREFPGQILVLLKKEVAVIPFLEGEFMEMDGMQKTAGLYKYIIYFLGDHKAEYRYIITEDFKRSLFDPPTTNS